MTKYQQVRRPISVEEYHKMIEIGMLGEKDKVELINGDLLIMSPVVTRITMLFAQLFGGKALVQIQSPISVGNTSEPEPNIALLKISDDFYFDKNRLSEDIYLLIEVSDSTYEFDKITKLKIYASANVPEYWIINIPENQIEIHRNPSEGIYKSISIALKNDTIASLSFSDTTIKVKDILG